MNYRREIDGLRALAVIPVIFFHAGFEVFSGGFVGVDIFFVISGYLITSIIVYELKSGTFSLVSFYERRARRILPALFFVMVACMPFAWVWLTPVDLKRFSESLVAVPVFASNILFWTESGYFDTAAELKPLLHTWSLAVEEQYYLLFPVFISLMWRFSKKWMFGLLLAAAAVSLTLAQWGAINKPNAAFYLLPTRGWELLIGVFCAFFLLNKKKGLTDKPIIAETVSLFGLMLIAYAVLTFDKQTPFPGFFALIPTIGTAFIIVFATEKQLVGKLLGCRLLVGVGLISYSTYLWHQPLFAFTRYQSLYYSPDISFLALAVTAMFLGFLSWKFVETPFRNKEIISRNQIFIIGAFGSFSFVVAGLAGYSNEGFSNRFNVPARVIDSLKLSAMHSTCSNKHKISRSPVVCLLGDEAVEVKPKIAVFGDSHSTVLMPAFDEIGKMLNVSVAHIGMGGCPPLLGVDVIKGNYALGVCQNLSEFQYEYVKEHEIEQVFLASRWSLYTNGGYNDPGKYYIGLDKFKYDRESSRLSFIEGFASTVKAYTDLGVELFVIVQVPQQVTHPQYLYYSMYDRDISSADKNLAIHGSSISRSKHEEIQSFSINVFRDYKNVKVINLENVFCDVEKCLLGNQEEAYYHDEDHLSNVGAALVVNEIIKASSLERYAF